VLGLLLIASAVATALLLAAASRLPGLVSTLLVAYLAYVANLGLVTLALSPLREVTRGGLAVAELVLLAGALACWSARGRPGLPLAAVRAGGRELVSDPLTALFLAGVLVLLAYELVLGLTVPPNNMDSLTYHLARAAAWAQHGGIYWIPNAPDVEMNAYQPLAEQQILYLFVATGSGGLFALPQFLAELALLTAVYGSARRLGFELRAAACAALLLATFSSVALESVTGQNDLVSASFPAVAACLLLGAGRLEPALAGVAVSFGLGTKLTTGLVLPFLIWLALARGRRRFTTALVGGAVGFIAIGMWGYVLNAVHTGNLLGSGTAGVQDRAPPSYPGSLANAFYLMYGEMDLSVLSNHLIDTLALVGVLVGAATAALAYRRTGSRGVLGDAVRVATPFLAPLLVRAGAGVIAFIARAWGFPIRGSGGILPPLDNVLNEVFTRFSNEDYSAYGPLGIVALLAAVALTIWAYLGRRADQRQLALACALPGFLILTSLQVAWVPFLVRFFLVPAGLTAPLLARLFRGRATTAAYLAVAALVVGLTITHDQSKPLESAYGRPWHYTQLEALSVNSDGYLAAALAAYDEDVPARACVGAVLGPDEPSYLLYGPRFEHHVVFLSVDDAVLPALRQGLFYVVISTGNDSWVAGRFRSAGWTVRPLGSYWLLASEPDAAGGSCAG